MDSLSQSQNELARRLDSANSILVLDQKELQLLQQNSKDSQKGLILIVIGLALESFGATALAGSFLGRKFVHITNFNYSFSAFDLGVTDAERDSFLWMVGLMGIFLLVLGFAGQFIGSLFAVTHTWFTSSLLFGFALIWIIIAIILLTRLDPDQSLQEKSYVLIRNIKRFLIHLFSKELRCWWCTKNLKLSEAQVWWYNDPIHPQLFSFGHPTCLQSMEIYNRRDVQDNLVKSVPEKFLNVDAVAIRAAFKEDKIGLRGKGSPGQSEADCEKIIKLLSKDK